MAHELTSFCTGGCKAHTVNHVVKTALEEQQQVGTGVAAHRFGVLEITAELTLEQTVNTLDLLLFAKLVAVVRHTSAGNFAVLARLSISILHFVFEGTAGALKVKIAPFATRKLELGTEITCHLKLASLILRIKPHSVFSPGCGERTRKN